MGFVNRIADDVLGFDPNGGGIHDIPVVGDIVDDQLGADPGESPLEQLGSVVGTIGAGVGAAGLAGIGPAAGLHSAVTTPVLNSVGLGGAGAAAAPVAGATGTAAGLPASAGTIGSTLGTVGSALGSLGSVGSTIGNVASGVAGLASGVGSLAEVYDAVTGDSAERDIEQIRATVPEVAGFTDDQIAGQLLARRAAEDPRVGQAVDSLYAAQQQAPGAIQTGLGTLSDIATGSDAASQRLAGQAASASQLGASQLGTLGSARQQRASQAAAADTLAQRQQSAAGTLASQGRGLLNAGSDAFNLAQSPGTALRNIGAQQQAQQQAVLNRPAQVAAAELGQGVRTPTGAERIGAIAGGLEALPTAIDQTGQGVNQFLRLFR